MGMLPETLCRAALERVGDALLLTEAHIGAEGPPIVYANPACCALTGYAAHELQGRGPVLLRGPHTGPGSLRRLLRGLRQGETAVGESVVHRRDGSPVVVGWRLEPLRNDAGTITHFLLVLRDRTGQRQDEQRRHQLETLARVHAEVAQGGLNLDRVRRRIAETAQEITGADGAAVEEPERGELVYRAVAGAAAGSLGLRLAVDGSLSGYCYRSLEPVLCGDTHRDPRVARGAARASGFRSGVVVPLVQGGRCYGVLKVYAGRPYRFDHGHVTLLTLVSGVLAAALHAALSFEAEVQRRRSLVDALPVLVAYLDGDGRFREVNAVFERWFGVRTSELPGRPLERALGASRYEALRPYVEAALRGEHVAFETSLRLPPGGRRDLEAVLTPDTDAEGRTRGLYAVVRDVTDLRIAETDYLTGLSTRRRFEQQGAVLLESARRYGRPFSLILLDVDHFKAINDRFGHPVGDSVLRELGALLLEETRSADLPARWGGEEFAIVAPETEEAAAVDLAERIRRRIAERTFTAVGAVTASFGVAGMCRNDSLAALQTRGDVALYRAKRLGRDRVARYVPEAALMG